MNISKLKKNLQHKSELINLDKENTKLMLYTFNNGTNQKPFDKIDNAPFHIKENKCDPLIDSILTKIFHPNYKYLNKIDDVERCINSLEFFDFENFLYFHYSNRDNSLIASFTRHLRNSVAHGSFNYRDETIYRLDKFRGDITMGLKLLVKEDDEKTIMFNELLKLIINSKEKFYENSYWIQKIIAIDSSFTNPTKPIYYDKFDFIQFDYKEKEKFIFCVDIEKQADIVEFFYYLINNIMIERNEKHNFYFLSVSKELNISKIILDCKKLFEKQLYWERNSFEIELVVDNFFKNNTLIFRNELKSMVTQNEYL